MKIRIWCLAPPERLDYVKSACTVIEGVFPLEKYFPCFLEADEVLHVHGQIGKVLKKRALFYDSIYRGV